MRTVLFAMVGLQAIWLAALWIRGEVLDLGVMPMLVVLTALATITVGGLSERFLSKLRRTKERLLQDERLLMVLLTVLLVTIGIAYGMVYVQYSYVGLDEMRSFHASWMVAEEGVGPFLSNYSRVPGLGRVHPPLMPLIYGLTMHLLGLEFFVVRLVAIVFLAGTVLVTYALGKTLYDRNTGLLAALFLIAIPYFVRIGVTATTDIPVTFFFACAVLLILRLIHAPSFRLSLATGLTIGFGLLSKYTMVLIYPVLMVAGASFRALKRVRLHLGLIVLVSVGMLATWLVVAHQIDALDRQKANLIRIASLVTTTHFGKRWLVNSFFRLPSALGVYHMPLLLMGGWHLFSRRNRSDRFVLGWSLCVWLFFMLTFPDPRYFLPCFPALAIVMSRGLTSVSGDHARVVLLALSYCGVVLSRGF